MTPTLPGRQGDGLNILLCSSAEVPPGGRKRISRGRHGSVAVFNVEGQFYVVDDRCTHGAASLSEGEVDGLQIICPLHRGSFDLVTGEALEPPCDRRLRTYRITVEGGDLYIEDA